MKHKGRRSRWFPVKVRPVHHGMYECGVWVTSAQKKLFLWDLEWDGIGFLVPCPMVAKYWRGLKHQPRGKA